MEPITLDDFDVIEHPHPAEIARHFAAAQAAAEPSTKAQEFVSTLNAIAAPAAVQQHGEFVSATWWVGDLADGLEQAGRSMPPASCGRT